MWGIKGSFCSCPQPTVFCHIFLNSSGRIWTLPYRIPLGCPLTSLILLSTSLCRCLVPVTLSSCWQSRPLPPSSCLQLLMDTGHHLHTQVGHQWSDGDRHWNSSYSQTVSALPQKLLRNSSESCLFSWAELALFIKEAINYFLVPQVIFWGAI